MSEPRSTDVCLQCGKTRAQVKEPYNSPCATATGYEVVEGLDDWDRHHWRDWSDAELARFGLTPSRFERNRRTDYYALEFEARASHCEREGHHSYPPPAKPPLSHDEMDMYRGAEDYCQVCYEKKGDDHE